MKVTKMKTIWKKGDGGNKLRKVLEDNLEKSVVAHVPLYLGDMLIGEDEDALLQE